MAGLRVTGLFLLDTSAWAQRLHHAAARNRMDELFVADQAATCLAVSLELLYQVRNTAEFERQQSALGELQWLPGGRDVEHAAIETMRLLTELGQHRTPLPDIMIAATARVHGATVVHYDSDFERIAEATGQKHEWIVPRGSGHGRA